MTRSLRLLATFPQTDSAAISPRGLPPFSCAIIYKTQETCHRAAMKETIGVRLDHDTIEFLRNLADANHRTLSNQTAFAVIAYVEGLRKALLKKGESK